MRVQKAIYIRHKSCPAAAHRGIRHEGTHKICQPRFSRAGSSGVPRKRRPISSTCRARSRRLLTVGCGNWPRAVPQRRVQSDLQPPTNPVDDHREEWLGAARSDDRSRIKALQSSVAEGADRWDVEYRIIGPDGDVRWLHERTFPVATLRGATFRVAGIAEAITALKKSLKENTHYEAQLQKLTRELNQAREKNSTASWKVCTTTLDRILPSFESVQGSSGKSFRPSRRNSSNRRPNLFGKRSTQLAT